MVLLSRPKRTTVPGPSMRKDFSATIGRSFQLRNHRALFGIIIFVLLLANAIMLIGVLEDHQSTKNRSNVSGSAFLLSLETSSELGLRNLEQRTEIFLLQLSGDLGKSHSSTQPNVELIPPNLRPIVGQFIPPEVLVKDESKQNATKSTNVTSADSAFNSLQWITSPTDQYKSTPYLPLATPIEEPLWAVGNDTANVPLPGKAVLDYTNTICQKLETFGHAEIATIFRKCFPNTLETTVRMLQDGRSYVITGDIDLMWLRDSSAQVHQYIQPELVQDRTIIAVVEGLLKMQAFLMRYDPYGSAFRPTFRPNPPSDDGMTPFHISKGRNVHTAMHNFELDSLLYPLWLAHGWWKATGRIGIFLERQWQESVWLTLDLMKREQRHFLNSTASNDCLNPPNSSCYRYLELGGRQHEGKTPVAWFGAHTDRLMINKNMDILCHRTVLL